MVRMLHTLFFDMKSRLNISKENNKVEAIYSLICFKIGFSMNLSAFGIHVSFALPQYKLTLNGYTTEWRTVWTSLPNNVFTSFKIPPISSLIGLSVTFLCPNTLEFQTSQHHFWMNGCRRFQEMFCLFYEWVCRASVSVSGLHLFPFKLNPYDF